LKIAFPKHWCQYAAEEAFDRVADQVDVDPDQVYQEIGIRSHGKGLFRKPPVKGSALGDKRVFWVQPDCLVLNIVFAWEQAVARTTHSENGMIASHRFPMFRPKEDRTNLDFVLYFLKSKWGKQLLELGSPGGAGRNKTLSQKEFGELPLCLPPLDEQRRIVAVLDTWGSAISETERLIAAERLRKNGLFQRLFKNLPKHPFLAAVDVRFSGVDKKLNAHEAQVLLCNYMDVFHNTQITAKLPFMQGTASRKEIEDNSLRRHDVVFTKDSETADEIAEPALVAEDIENLVCGYHLAIARPREGVAYGPFVAQAMRHQDTRWQFRRLANGVVRFGLTLDAIEQVEIFLPELARQQQIASVLDAEDASIEALRQSHDRLRAQRRGLMQKLLTGEMPLDGRFDLPSGSSRNGVVGKKR
jgi:type I restriction enzyme S subunit